MKKIPQMSDLDMAFGNIKHMPSYYSLPEEFTERSNKYEKFISQWFFGSIGQSDINRLKPKQGVNKQEALRAIKAILVSFEPKHEHKTAGCAYLLSQWFELEEETK